MTDRHTAIDYAHVLKDLADVHFPHKTAIVLVQDDLNIHSKASLYEAFPPAEARRLVERFEWHYTPKHGSWLDLAESELGVLAAMPDGRRSLAVGTPGDPPATTRTGLTIPASYRLANLRSSKFWGTDDRPPILSGVTLSNSLARQRRCRVRYHGRIYRTSHNSVRP